MTNLTDVRRHTKRRRNDVLIGAILALLAFLGLFPFGFALIGSFKNSAQFTSSYWLPALPLHLENYSGAWAQISTFWINSLIVGIATSVVILALGTVSGFVFARYRFPGRETLFYIIIILLAVPGVAKLDGASGPQTFLQIVLPLSIPAMGTVIMTTLTGVWNEYLWALLVINDPAKRTIGTGLQFFTTQVGTETNAARLLRHEAVRTGIKDVSQLTDREHDLLAQVWVNFGIVVQHSRDGRTFRDIVNRCHSRPQNRHWFHHFLNKLYQISAFGKPISKNECRGNTVIQTISSSSHNSSHPPISSKGFHTSVFFGLVWRFAFSTLTRGLDRVTLCYREQDRGLQTNVCLMLVFVSCPQLKIH